MLDMLLSVATLSDIDASGTESDDDSSASSGSSSSDSDVAPSTAKKARAGAARGGRTPGSRSTVKKAGRASATKSRQGKVADVDDDAPLWERIKSRGVALQTEVEAWTMSYEENSVKAVADIANLVFRAAGINADVVSPTLDLNDAADNTLDTLATEACTTHGMESKAPPLLSRSKDGKRARKAFSEFWRRLVSYNRHAGVAMTEMMADVSYVLCQLSETTSHPVRHTAVVASMNVGLGIIAAIQEGELSKTKSQRQLTAAQKKGRSPGAAVQQLQRALARAELGVETLVKSLDELYRGVFLNRYRDVQADVRQETFERFHEWIRAFPARYCQTTYVKYLIYGTADQHAGVRREAAAALATVYGREGSVEALSTLTARFKDRYAKLVRDRDPAVAIEAVRLLEALNDPDHEDGDPADLGTHVAMVLMCDDAARRRAAAKYLMNALAGFSSEEQAAASSTSAKAAVATQARLQLRSLAELLVVLSRKDDTEHVARVVDGFWGAEGAEVLQNWDAFVAAAVDGEEFSEEPQVRKMLLALMAECVHRQCRGVDGALERPKGFAPKRADDTTAMKKCSEVVGRALPKLFAQYAAEPSFTACLAEIPQDFYLGAFRAGSSKDFPNLLSCLNGVYMRSASEEVLKPLASAFWRFTSSSNPHQRASESELRSMLSVLTKRMTDLLAIDEADGADEPKKPARRRRSSRGAAGGAGADDDMTDETAEGEDGQTGGNEFALSLALRRLRYLCDAIDCVALNDSLTTDGDATIALLALVERRLNVAGLYERKLGNPIARVAEDALRILYSTFQSSFVGFVRGFAAATDEAGTDHVNDVLDAAVALRDSLVRAGAEMLQLPDVADPSADDDAQSDDAREAQQLMSDYITTARRTGLHTLLGLTEVCSSFLSETKLYKLAWQPDEALSITMRDFVQDSINAPLTTPTVEELGEDDVSDMDEAVSAEAKAQRVEQDLIEVEMETRVSDLVAPTSRASIASQLYPTIPGAVLEQYAVDHPTAVVEAKRVAKALKNRDFNELLDAHYAALVGQMNDCLAMNRDEREAEERGETIAEGDETPSMAAFNFFLLTSESLARSLGVKKLDRERMLPFMRFLHNGLKFAFAEHTNEKLGFLDALQPYLRLASPKGLVLLSQKLQEQIDGLPDDLRAEFAAIEAEPDETSTWSAVIAFRDRLSATASPKKRARSTVRRTRKKRTPRHNDYDSDISDASVPRNSGSTAKKVSAKSKSRRSRGVDEDVPLHRASIGSSLPGGASPSIALTPSGGGGGQHNVRLSGRFGASPITAVAEEDDIEDVPLSNAMKPSSTAASGRSSRRRRRDDVSSDSGSSGSEEDVAPMPRKTSPRKPRRTVERVTAPTDADGWIDTAKAKSPQKTSTKKLTRRRRR